MTDKPNHLNEVMTQQLEIDIDYDDQCVLQGGVASDLHHSQENEG